MCECGCVIFVLEKTIIMITRVRRITMRIMLIINFIFLL